MKIIELETALIDEAIDLVKENYKDNSVIRFIADGLPESKQRHFINLFATDLILSAKKFGRIVSAKSNNELIGLATFYLPSPTSSIVYDLLHSARLLMCLGLKRFSHAKAILDNLNKVKTSEIPNKNFLYAEFGCVKKSFRGTGIAKKLTDHFFNIADSLKVPTLGETSDSRTLPIWESYGYKIYSTEEILGNTFWHFKRHHTPSECTR